MEKTIRFLSVERIRRGRWQARREFDPLALEELADSIRENGLLQPISVRYEVSRDDYELIAGERRWRAAQIAGLYEIPALVHAVSVDEAAVLSLVENLQREDLKPLEEADGFQRLLDDFQLKHIDVAEKVGKSRAYVSNALRLLKLVPEVQALIDAGDLHRGHAKPLVVLSPSWQRQLATQAIRYRWSVRQLEKKAGEVSRLQSGQELKDEEQRDPNLQRLEQQLSETLGHAVQIDWDAAKQEGELKLRFHSADGLEGVLEKLGIEAV